jgi:hypothetical protein
MVALLAAAIVAGRRKIGIVPSFIVGGVLFVALSAVGWSGGRDVSVESGDDRMEAWSTGIQLIRSHPIFGVGYQRFNEFFYITAHNSVVVTAAELGMVGLFFWLVMIVSTVRDVSLTSRDPNSASKTTESAQLPRTLQEHYVVAGVEQRVTGTSMLLTNSEATTLRPYMVSWHPLEKDGVEPDLPSPFQAGQEAVLPDAEYRRMASLMVVSLAGFLTAGWFLSRSYTMVLFCYVGLAASVYRLALARHVAPNPWSLGKASRVAGVASVLLIGVVYIMLRLQHFFHL